MLVAWPSRGRIARFAFRSSSRTPFGRVPFFPDLRVGALCFGVLHNLRCCRFAPRNTLSTLLARSAARILRDAVFVLLGPYFFVHRDLLYASLGAFVRRGLRPLAATVRHSWSYVGTRADRRSLYSRCGGSLSGLIFVAAGLRLFVGHLFPQSSLASCQVSSSRLPALPPPPFFSLGLTRALGPAAGVS